MSMITVSEESVSDSDSFVVLSFCGGVGTGFDGSDGYPSSLLSGDGSRLQDGLKSEAFLMVTFSYLELISLESAFEL